MEKTRSFESMIRNHDITAEEFFEVKGIASDIKNNVAKFVSYCKKHKVFTQRMMQLGLNVAYEELQEQRIKNAAFAITEVLANEDEELAELFFQEEKIKNSSQISQKISEEPECNIQSQAERLFMTEQLECLNDDVTDCPQQERQIQIMKYQVAKWSLQILKKQIKNQTCLGHITKIFSFLIRHNPSQVLQFLSQNPEYKSLLLSNVKYASVSSLLAQLLTCQDKKRQYKYEQLKKGIVESVIEMMFQHIQDQNIFEGIILLVDEIFNSTKQSYYEYFEDFKRIANLLVNKATLQRVFDVLMLHKESSFKNGVKFLESLVHRINSEREDNSYYNRGEQSQPSMQFQIDIFYQNLSKIISMIPQIQNFGNLSRISYMSFVIGLLDSIKNQKYSINLDENLILLMDCLNREKVAGVYKNKLYNLISKIIERQPNQKIMQFLNSHQNIYSDFFESLKKANSSSTKNYNKSLSAGFDLSLLLKLSKKNDKVVQNAKKAIDKDLKQMMRKYETKIANFSQSNNFSMEQESSFYQYSSEQSSKFKGQAINHSNDNSSGSLQINSNLVGKNNVSIPILHLPDRYQKGQSQKKNQREQIEEVEVIDVQKFFLPKQYNLHKKNQNEPQSGLSISVEYKEEEIQEPKEITVDNFKQVKVETQQSKVIPGDSQQKIKYFVKHPLIYV